jgi:3-keto-5-aminohexanoate cleavage enzyme
MANDEPVIIEVAINGTTGKDRNPHSPCTPAEVAEVAIACIDAGASMIHSHIGGMGIAGKEAAEEYAAGWRPVRARHPAAIVYPTVVFHDDPEVRFGHLPFLAEMGIGDMAVLDPGSVNFSYGDEDGLPGKDYVYVNSYSSIRFAFERMEKLGLGPSLALYDPSFARSVIAWHRAGRLPRGTFVKFYFGGDHNFITGERGGPSFGLPPTRKALDAYLEMFEGVDLPWATALLGGDAVASGITRYGIERGGHIRIGLEDWCGEGQPSNLDLIEAAVKVCREVGRPIATQEQARAIVGLRSPAMA